MGEAASESNVDHALISDAERKRIASGRRLATALMVMVSLIVVCLTGLIVVLVSQVFDSMTPAAASDLHWKAQRGAVELSRTADLGLLVHDSTVIRSAAEPYLSSADVTNVVAVDAQDELVFVHGPDAEAVAKVFALPSGQVHSLAGRLVAWSPSQLEGASLGKVAVAVSTSRLEAGDQLKLRIITAAVVGGIVALLLSAAFVALYISPILRLTQAAFTRLEHATHEALEGARLKAQFLANMSHEIRTPMNAVVGLAKLMLSMPLGTKVRRYAEMIDSSSRALLSIINDILDFSKIEAGKYEVICSPCEPAMIVQEVAELLAERTQGKGVDLVYRIAREVPRVVEADADRLRQVLLNLVSNAVKFTEQGEVYVQLLARPLDEDKVELRFQIQDSGIGIPAEHLSSIFDAFSQADGTMVRKHGGTGLGLAISRHLTALMGGELGVTSEVGKGSTFWFTVPLVVVDATSAVRSQPTSIGKRALIVCDNEHAGEAIEEHFTAWGMTSTRTTSVEQAELSLREAVATAVPFDLVLVSETHSGMRAEAVVDVLRKSVGKGCPPVVVLSQMRELATRNEVSEEIAAQLAQPVRMSELYETLSRVLLSSGVRVEASTSKAAGTARSFNGVRILVVDDNEVNQFVASEHLTRLGCQVDQAMNGQLALEAVLANEYALVLMDCQMPVMDGYTATREIRAREVGRRTVIVALTAHALQGERERVLGAGMDDYLTKPVRPVTLQRALERWIALPAEGSGASGDANDDGLTAALSADTAPANDVESPLEDCATGLLQVFMDKVPMQLELLDGALAVGDLTEARAHAHKLKGSLLSLEVQDLAGLAEKLQHQCEAEAPAAETEPVFTALLAGFGKLEARIKQVLSERARAERGASRG